MTKRMDVVLCSTMILIVVVVSRRLRPEPSVSVTAIFHQLTTSGIGSKTPVETWQKRSSWWMMFPCVRGEMP
jgi:hypothetical protein